MTRQAPRRSRVGKLLVLYRATHGISLRDLSAELGISASTLSRIERGYEMDARTLIRLWTWLLEGQQGPDVAM